MEQFKKLFESYGYKVEKFTERSYLADNGKICVPYTEYTDVPNGRHYMCGASFLSCDKDKLKEIIIKRENRYRFPIEIGFEVWDGCMNGWLMKAGICRYGRIGNHDHSIYEIEDALKLMK